MSLDLVTAEGAPLQLASLRGHPLLIFVFATFDDVSQLALTALERFLDEHADLKALGIAVQPNPQKLLPLYRDTLDVSFELSFDPEDRVVSGRSELGTIPTIPTYIVLDARGRIVARHTGGLDEAGLADLTTALDRD